MMTPPALVWATYDSALAPASCSWKGCNAKPAVMRGPRSPLIRLPWRSYCAEHAVLAGVPRQQRV